MSPSRQPWSSISSLGGQVYDDINWFRLHLLAYTIMPIIVSGCYMAANPSGASYQFVTAYIDALFMCFSAMTVTGLNTVSVSALQPAQQAFLFILMLVGDISIVNLITIVCRQSWFLVSCRRVVKHPVQYYCTRNTDAKDVEGGNHAPRGVETGRSGNGGDKKAGRRKAGRAASTGDEHSGIDDVNHSTPSRGETARSSEQTAAQHSDDNKGDKAWNEGFRRRHQKRTKTGGTSNTSTKPGDPHGRIPHASTGKPAHTGRGGFPSPFLLFWRVLSSIFPRTMSKLSDSIRQTDGESTHTPHAFKELESAVKKTLAKRKDDKEDEEAKRVKWLPDDMRTVVVGRNSQFFEEEMHADDLVLLGAIEYRATRLLSILLMVHILFWILVPGAIMAIYLGRSNHWNAQLTANASTQSGTPPTAWYSFFQAVSAYSSCGLSLVDQGMIPFDDCYLLIYVLIFAMLAGNQALPLFLRFEIWLLSKVIRNGGETEVSLHFILTHSRRFFLYLFPAYQSWWLASMELSLCIVGTVLFVLFNMGEPYYDSLGNAWARFSIGLFESWASRASGFGIVSLSDLAPGTDFLYLILIFTSNYPLVMAIRSTNVYEERALGMSGDHAPNQQNQERRDRGAVFSKYLKHHLLPQIYFDLWPIAIGTMLICVAERGTLLNSNNSGWVDVFRVLFEATSAYGTIGLSYGNPYNTSSLSASFGVVAKLIIILLMIRGRHRGLPLAIDRATMFPIEYLRLSDSKREKVEEDRVHQAGAEADAE